MPKLYNKHHGDAPPDAVYIGRGSLWGNPFSHQSGGNYKTVKVATREEAVEAYEESIKDSEWFIADIKKKLKGRDLVCFCAPERCHGEVLLRIANEED